jgi:hypothetical protein
VAAREPGDYGEGSPYGPQTVACVVGLTGVPYREIDSFAIRNKRTACGLYIASLYNFIKCPLKHKSIKLRVKEVL